MKKAISFLIAVTFFIEGFSQSVVSRVEYQKSQQTAAMIELPYTAELVEGALKDYFSRKGTKSGDSKGFMTFRNVLLPGNEAGGGDMYFKVNRKSRKENDMSVIYLLVAKPNEAVATRSSEDDFGMEQAKKFLNEITPSINSYSLDLQIREQEELVKKAERKFSSLVEDQRDLESRKKSIEDKLMTNVRDQDKQKSELEKQRALLELLNNKRRGNEVVPVTEK